MKTDNRYRRCNESISLGRRLRLKNRLYFAPMGIDAAEHSGCASSELINFYEGIIAGGAGMVVLGNASIDSNTRLQVRGLCLHDDAHMAALRPLFVKGRRQQCEVVVQLQHYGAQGNTALSGGVLLSPSGVPCARAQGKDPGYRTVEMTLSNIATVRRQFVTAAGRAQLAGARMVQLQASNGYLLSSFISPYTNRRTDAYGGDPGRRMRLLCEVIADIRHAYPAMEVSVRLGIDDGLPEGGQRPELIAPQLAMLDQLDVAAIELSMTVGETFHQLLQPSDSVRARLANGIRVIRAATRLPLGFAGFVADLADAEKARAELGVDLVGMSRALFADNELILKTLQGRDHEIHRCRFDGNCFKDKSNAALDRVYCCVNPRYRRPSHIRYI
ncbi:2,4-dienoyl-CoA reductase-like NADH-dependent reductase (Old Yellow Enzyme family) [Paraburkholderia sp. HC6.4b]|uniref:oxidoreductase n=1 Tax=unclassified Paraburkholderia TaxID=2615204 RepID=UPI0017D37910|nr:MULTISPECIES: hypothetical protein [unclassified Paraburkholderia]MBB5409776.1 2,4-dienoyl-CoA reductase-like NADH-dependent reductase (Old Yellow Enzyme family) [Paraburkholderia sp. HC6.4b]MBB5451751.1 2,4-dienoyl-CoA reductase-like NADH-dependent reductase (Old Yellow Enzyme family) [Paraburkholderia sp. Kb1A]